MPVYDYQCQTCGRKTLDRHVKAEDKDVQICAQPIEGHAWPAPHDSVLPRACGGKLIREEIGLTAKMGHAWQP